MLCTEFVIQSDETMTILVKPYGRGKTHFYVEVVGTHNVASGYMANHLQKRGKNHTRMKPLRIRHTCGARIKMADETVC